MFQKLAQMNVDHYNNHTARHNAIIVAMSVVTVVGVNKFVKRIAKEDPTLRSGQYA